MSNVLTERAQALAVRLIAVANEEFPGLSFFEIQQGLGAASITLTHQSLSAADITDEQRREAIAEADAMAELILVHMDAVRKEKGTAPAVDFMAAANTLTHVAVHLEVHKQRLLTEQAANAGHSEHG